MKINRQQLRHLVMEAMSPTHGQLLFAIDELLSGDKKRLLRAATVLQDAGYILQRMYNGPDDIAFLFDRDTMTQKRKVKAYEMVRHRYNEIGTRGEAQYDFMDSYYRLDVMFPGAHPDF